MLNAPKFVRFKFTYYTIKSDKTPIPVESGVVIVPSQPRFNMTAISDTSTLELAFGEICDYLKLSKPKDDFIPFGFNPTRQRDSSLKRTYKRVLGHNDRCDYILIETKLCEFLHKRDKKEWDEYSDHLSML